MDGAKSTAAHKGSRPTVALAPFQLLQEHAAELGQRIGKGIVERPEDAFAVIDLRATTSARVPATSPERSVSVQRRDRASPNYP